MGYQFKNLNIERVKLKEKDKTEKVERKRQKIMRNIKMILFQFLQFKKKIKLYFSF